MTPNTAADVPVNRVATVGLVLVFFAGIFEGSARKWVLAGLPEEYSYVAYLSKFMALALLCVLVRPGRSLAATRAFGGVLGIAVPLLAFGAMFSATVNLSLAGAVITGTTAIAGPVMCYLVARRVLLVDFILVARWVVLFSFAPAALGVVQFGLPPDHILNTYVAGSDSGSVISDLGRVRATGTFSFISGMGAMSMLAVWAGLFLRAQAIARADREIGLAGVAAGLLCGLTSLSRGAVLFAVLILLGRLFLGGRDRMLGMLSVAALVAFGLILSDLDLPREDTATIASGVFVRHQRADTVAERIWVTVDDLAAALDSAPMGAGFGVGQIGASAVDAGEYRLRTIETEAGRLVLEVGVLGLFATLLVRFTLAWQVLSVGLRLRPGADRTAVLVSAITLIAFLVNNSAFNHVMAGFLWPLGAIALAHADRVRYLHGIGGPA